MNKPRVEFLLHIHTHTHKSSIFNLMFINYSIEKIYTLIKIEFKGITRIVFQ